MDSPWLELSNGILFAKFRRRLSAFPFSGLILLENRVLQTRDGSSREGDGFLFWWGPVAVKEMEGKGGADRVDSAQGIRPHMSYLMRDNIYAPGSHKFSISFKTLFSAIKVSPLFGSPNLHPDSSSAPSCTQETP
jgi:hypothetical protein